MTHRLKPLYIPQSNITFTEAVQFYLRDLSPEESAELVKEE